MRLDPSSLLHDLTVGLRAVRRQPGFATLAILTFGLGIGAATTLFAFLDGVLLRPLPYPEPDRLVHWIETTPQGSDFSVSEPNFLDFEERSRTFEAMAAFGGRTYPLLGGDRPIQVDGAAVSGDFFAVFGVDPAVGRAIEPRDDLPGAAAKVVVLGHGLWRRLGGDESILGRSVDLGGEPHTVVGVMPEGFRFPDRADLWHPLGTDPTSARGNHELDAIGRLREGIDFEAARADLAAIAADLSTEYPDSNRDWGVHLRALDHVIVRPEMRRTLVVLQAGVGVLLLMACASVANLILARTSRRREELAVRRALGAAPLRLLRQLLAESLTLSLAGGAVGALVATFAVPFLRDLAPADLPRIAEVAPSPRLLLFAVVAATLSALLAGLWPAARASIGKGDPLRSARTVSGRADRATSDALAVVEIGFATLLLVGAALLAASFLRLADTDLGYAPEQVVSVPLALTGEVFGGDKRAPALFAIEERLAGLPGVSAVGSTNIRPFGGGSTRIELEVEGRVVAPGEDHPFVDWRLVTPGLFAALDVPILEGRALLPEDARPDAPRRAVVSRTLAERLFPGDSAVGRRVAMSVGSENWIEIVGVTGDVLDVEVDRAAEPILFFPPAGFMWPQMNVLLRTDLPASTLAASIRDEIRAVAPSLPVPEVLPLEGHVDRALATSRLAMLLMATFAAAATLLATVAIYGVVASSVARRRREIGLRLALGSSRPGVVRLMVAQGLRRIVLGLAVGLAGSWALARGLESLLYETTARDPRIYLGVALGLATVALLASWWPASRAAAVEPRAALAEE